MKQVTVTVVDPVGLHARPATVAVTQLLDEYFRAYLSCSLEMTNKAMLPYLK